MNMKYLTTTAFLGAFLTACGGDTTATTEAPAEVVEEKVVEEVMADKVMEDLPSDAMDAVLAGSWRTEQSARDQFRNPKETLAFFGLEADMSVVEISPGGGWYTGVIAPYLAQGGGTYIAADRNPTDSEGNQQRVDAFKERFGDTDVFGNVQMAVFNKETAEIVPAGSVDMVLTFRNVHNWMGGSWEQEAINKMAAALKPGGVLGLVEHRAKTDEPQDPAAKSGYVREDYVIEFAKNAGLEFAGGSEVNANPADTADHPFGVWTLPPRSYTGKDDEALSEEDAAKFKAIGESDRMTLKFVKPVE